MRKQKIADASFSSNSTRGDARASNEVDAVAGRITNVITFANRGVLGGVAGGRAGGGGDLCVLAVHYLSHVCVHILTYKKHTQTCVCVIY